MNLAEGLQHQVLQSGVEVLAHEHAVAGGQQVDVLIRNIASQADEASPQHHALESGNRLGNRPGLRNVHQSKIGSIEPASQVVGIQLAWKYRHVDLAGDQGVDPRAIIQIDETGGRIDGVAGVENLQDQRAYAGSRRADGHTFAAELGELRDRLGASVKDEDDRVEHPTHGVEVFFVAGLRKTERAEGG